MDVMIHYDQSFSDRFSDVTNVIRRVATQFLFSKFEAKRRPKRRTDLLILIITRTNSKYCSSQNFITDPQRCQILAALIEINRNVLGIAWVGTICSITSYRTAVVEYFQNYLKTAEVCG